MKNLAVIIIKDAVMRIEVAMKEGTFTREELLVIKKVFEKGVELTDKVLAED